MSGKICRSEGKIMAPPPLKLVSPQGVLHLVPNEKHALIAFCKAHGLRKEYLMKHINSDVKYKTHHLGWSLLERVKWMQQPPSAAIVPVIGSAETFFDKRAFACERAGLAMDAMPFAIHELRQFNRLLDPEDSLVELHGWIIIEEPPLIKAAQCSSTCPTCLCKTADLFELLSARVPDELTLLRQQLAVTQQQLAQSEKERSTLAAQSEKHTKAMDTVSKAARRRKERIVELKAKMMKLSEASHLAFERLFTTRAPPSAKHLKHLFDAQLRALKSTSLRTYWHEEILNWCAKIFRKDRGAYELMWSGQMLLLPHPDTIRTSAAPHHTRAPATTTIATRRFAVRPPSSARSTAT